MSKITLNISEMGILSHGISVLFQEMKMYLKK